MLKDFKEFAMKGNMVDMAIGVIIGGAFGKVVTSLVNDLVMPPIGLLLGQVEFTSLFLSLNGQAYPSLAAAKAAGAPTLNYGVLVNTALDFLLVAFVMFLVVKQMNRLKRAPAPLPPAKKECPLCLSQIPVAASRCAFCTATLER